MKRDPIICQIVDIDCHVSMMTREVVRYVISKLRNGYTTFRALSQAERQRFIEDCVSRHRENVTLYMTVMNGRTRQPSASAGSGIVSVPPEFLTGARLRRLMQQHRVTIGDLSRKMGIPQRRIRQARLAGLSDSLAIRDWLQAITGLDPGPIPHKHRITAAHPAPVCDFCGCPMMTGEVAYSYLSETFCSHFCCRQSRG